MEKVGTEEGDKGEWMKERGKGGEEGEITRDEEVGRRKREKKGKGHERNELD